MLDAYIESPGITKAELGRRFNRRASWVVRIVGSPAFQAALAERRAARRARIDAEVAAVFVRSIEVMQAKLAADPNTIDNGFAVRAFEASGKLCGYGRDGESAPAASVNMTLHLQELGDAMVRLFRAKRAEAIEGTAEPIPPSE